MTKNEFYEKYFKIIEENNIDTNKVVSMALAVIQADNTIEEGNSKPLNIDDFAFTLTSDIALGAKLKGITLGQNVIKAKEMYEIQLYRLLLDALMLTMGKEVPKECGLLRPSALKTAEILKLKITKGGDVYATEEECIKVLDALADALMEEKDSDASDKFYEFFEFLRKIYIKNPTLFNIICVEILATFKQLPVATNYHKLELPEELLFNRNMNMMFEFNAPKNMDDIIFETLVKITNKWVIGTEFEIKE